MISSLLQNLDSSAAPLERGFHQKTEIRDLELVTPGDLPKGWLINVCNWARAAGTAAEAPIQQSVLLTLCPHQVCLPCRTEIHLNCWPWYLENISEYQDVLSKAFATGFTTCTATGDWFCIAHFCSNKFKMLPEQLWKQCQRTELVFYQNFQVYLLSMGGCLHRVLQEEGSNCAPPCSGCASLTTRTLAFGYCMDLSHEWKVTLLLFHQNQKIAILYREGQIKG